MRLFDLYLFDVKKEIQSLCNIIVDISFKW